MKVLFINENIGGHATVHHHLRRSLARHPDIDATFMDVPAPGLLRRLVGASWPVLGRADLDLQPLRAQLALSWWVRRRVAPLVDSFDAIHLYTQNAGLLSTALLRQRPTVVSTDTTNTRNAYRLPYRRPTRFTPWSIPLSRWAEGRVFAAAHRVVANSAWAAESLRDDYGLDSVTVLPFGITAPANLPASSVPRRPRIVFLGRQFEAKSGPMLVAAWRASVADRADLVLVTKDEVEAEPGLTVINDLDQGDDRLWEILGQATILAFPSTIDQAPNAVIEAMAAGLAVVATPTAAVTEMVIDGETGYHVAADDIHAWGRALTELVDDPAHCAALGRRGRARFEAIYDADRATDALVALLAEGVTAAADPAPTRPGPAATAGRWRQRAAGPISALGQTARGLPIGRPQAAAGGVVLGYHDIAPDASGLTVTPDQLDAHLTLLTRLGLRIVPLEEIVSRLETGRRVDRLAAITFDDALLGVHRYGLAVLAAHDVTATVFTVSAHRGVAPPWWPGAQRTLDTDELGDVVAAGHRLGSHTVNHESLPTLAPAALTAELVQSREQLERLAEDPVDLLAYPSGHHDAEVRRAARHAGYRAGFTFLNGRVGPDDDRLMLPRLTMGAHMTRPRLSYHLLRSASSWPDHQLDRVEGSPW